MKNTIFFISLILFLILIFYIISNKKENFIEKKERYFKYDQFLQNHLKISNQLNIIEKKLGQNNNNIPYYLYFKDTFNKFFIINLPETYIGKIRWNRIRNNPILINYSERFPGVNGRLTDFNLELNNGIITQTWNWGKWKHNKDYKIPFSKPEMGVAISHYKIWKKIVDENIKSTLILEDDAIRISKDFERVVINTFNNVPEDWDIILLGFSNHTKIPDIKINQYIYKVKNFILLHSYFVSNKGAKKLLSNLPISAPVDTWISSLSDKLNIYRHNEISNKKVYSRIIRQALLDKQNINTNITHK